MEAWRSVVSVSPRSRCTSDPSRGIVGYATSIRGGGGGGGAGGPPDPEKFQAIDQARQDLMADMPKSDEAVANNRLFSLAFRNLLRGKKLLLPSGQSVAKAMHVTPLTDDEILIGAAENDAADEMANARKITDVSAAFAGKCPLWTYILAEARRSLFHPPANQQLHKAQLGPVGGRIVAEVFCALLMKDPRSFFNAPTPWAPDLGSGRNFSLADLIRIVREG